MREELLIFLIGCLGALIPSAILILGWKRRLWRIDRLRDISQAETLEELSGSLRSLLQKISPKVFVDYDGYFRESMYEDDEEFYDFFHEHFTPFEARQSDLVLSPRNIGNVRFIGILIAMPAVFLIILFGFHELSYLARMLFLLPMVAMYIFFIVFYRERPKLLHEEFELLQLVDDKFASLLSRKLYPENPAG